MLKYVQQGLNVLVEDIALGGLAQGFFCPVVLVKVVFVGQGPWAVITL